MLATRPLITLALLAGVVSGFAETLAVLPAQVGTTPRLLGYNLGHFLEGTNAADRFRFSGVNAARVFIGAADIEPGDDIAPYGDGVADEAGFFERRGLLRANAASATEALDPSYVNWSKFSANYGKLQYGNNRLRPDFALAALRDMGVSILVNISATPGKFPIDDDGDWAGKWELWQHYYAQAFLLSRDDGVANFSMFNEPNNYDGLEVDDWQRRYIICSDAIQSAVADMDSRYGKHLTARVYAPNTANGAEKYESWGRAAVANRHLRIDGSQDADWMNLQVYNYQKYTHRTNAADGYSGFIEDYNSLRASIDADMVGEARLPMAITEFNVRTGALYDTMPDTQDSPGDYTALGADCVALAERGMDEMYLFKFGQTASDSYYGVAKNGAHYVENSGDYNYGGATKAANVYRLFVRAAAGGVPRLALTAGAGAQPTPAGGVWSMATRDAAGDYRVFIVNKESAPLPLDIDFSALPVPPGNPVFVEEVSGAASGGVVRPADLNAGILSGGVMPGQSVWLATIPAAPVSRISRTAVADAVLADGAGKFTPGGAANPLQVRADGTVDGRRAALIRIPVPAGNSPNIRNVLLEMEIAANGGGEPVSGQVYGIDSNSWDETTATWASADFALKQNVPAGGKVQNNIVPTDARFLGEIVADSQTAAVRSLDVTEFAKSRTDGFATFLVVQDHRWDVALPELTTGDIQPAGIAISSREAGAAGPRLVALVEDVTGSVRIGSEATIRGGSFADQDVDEAAAGYLMVKTNAAPEFSRKSYFQFVLPAAGVDLEAAADFTVRFTASYSQRVQLWSLDGGGLLSSALTWNAAPANDTASNGMLAATAIGGDTLVSPGSGLAPFTFHIPKLGDHVRDNLLTLALTGADGAGNNAGGLRIAPGSAALAYGLPDMRPWSLWRKAEFGADWDKGKIAGELADPDRDGLPNLLEYALRGWPLGSQPGISPEARAAGGTAVLEFTRNPAATDLRFLVEMADSPAGPWQLAAASDGGGAFVAEAGISVSETAENRVTVTAPNADRRFFRLGATLSD